MVQFFPIFQSNKFIYAALGLKVYGSGSASRIRTCRIARTDQTFDTF
jgi:hypothetical protein